MEPYSLDSMQMVVEDADADAVGAERAESGHPGATSCCFQDHDGNGWAGQQLPHWAIGAGGSGGHPYVVGG